MALTKPDLMHLSQLPPFSDIPPRDMGLFSLYLSRREKPPPLAMAGPFCGAPLAVMGLEKLIALGATDVWVFGWCGSIQSDLRVGDVILPLHAVSEEGTSQHYPIAMGRAAAHQDLLNPLKKALEKAGLPFTQGPVWTTDAPYRETAQKVKDYQGAGVLAVEMELSALLAVAAYREVRLAALMVVSDELFKLKWVPGFSRSRFRKRTYSAGEALLYLVDSLCNEPSPPREP
jgi:uridine phosphorylase